MIPADHITIDGTTAWLVQPCEIQHPERIRPCDTCDGQGYCLLGEPEAYECESCDGTGRHTFEIEVEPADSLDDFINTGDERTLRVHVVPGMVLPIVDEVELYPCIVLSHMLYSDGQSAALLVSQYEAGRITLPPAAEPGMWAVQLRIHTPENVDGPT